MTAGSLHRSSALAVWMPRALAVAVLLAGTAAVVGETGQPWLATGLRLLVWAATLGLALWLWWGGRDSQIAAALQDDRLVLVGPRGRREIAARDVEAVDLEPAFATLGRWFPAVILLDRFGRRWRLPVTLERGVELVERLIEAAGRDDLRAWYEARAIRRRARRQWWIVPLGYAIAAALLLRAARQALG